MSTVLRDRTVANVRENSFISEVSQECVDRLLVGFDPSQETVRKVTLVTTSKPFHQVGGKYACYREVKMTDEQTWNKPPQSVRELIPAEILGSSTVQELAQIVEQLNSDQSALGFLSQSQEQYGALITNPSQVVQSTVSDMLQEGWEGMAKAVQAHVGQHGPLAFVESNLEMQIEVVRRDNTPRILGQKFEFKVCDSRLLENR